MPRLPNAARLWATLDDRVCPALRLTPYERALYFHLARHSLLLGRPTLRATKSQLARATGMCLSTVRDTLRSLARHSALRILDHGQSGLLISLASPSKLFSAQPPRPLRLCGKSPRVKRLRLSPGLRQKVFQRHRGNCFYCLRPLRRGAWVLDHVIPQARNGPDSPSNLVAACSHCNLAKADKPAADFLQRLFKQGILRASELRSRFTALRRLQKHTRH